MSCCIASSSRSVLFINRDCSYKNSKISRVIPLFFLHMFVVRWSCKARPNIPICRVRSDIILSWRGVILYAEYYIDTAIDYFNPSSSMMPLPILIWVDKHVSFPLIVRVGVAIMDCLIDQIIFVSCLYDISIRSITSETLLYVNATVFLSISFCSIILYLRLRRDVTITSLVHVCR